jgi:hypothetical protein
MSARTLGRGRSNLEATNSTKSALTIRREILFFWLDKNKFPYWEVI